MAERRLRSVLDSLSLSLRPEKLRIQKWYTVYKDHISLEDYEIHDGMGLELYCKRPTAAILFSCCPATFWPMPTAGRHSPPALALTAARPPRSLTARGCGVRLGR